MFKSLHKSSSRPRTSSNSSMTIYLGTLIASITWCCTSTLIAMAMTSNKSIFATMRSTRSSLTNVENRPRGPLRHSKRLMNLDKILPKNGLKMSQFSSTFACPPIASESCSLKSCNMPSKLYKLTENGCRVKTKWPCILKKIKLSYNR